MPTLALATAAPKVTLRSSPAVPYDGAIAAARTCYSPRVIERSEVTDKQRDSIGPLTFEGGHHTVFQHAHFEFGLENISRQLVWSVLHSYPFYNSEQSSQRYVKLNEPRAFVPPTRRRSPRRLRTGHACARGIRTRGCPSCSRTTRGRFSRNCATCGRPIRAARLKTVEREAEKKAIETARYVIPIGAFTSMVHTVSGIVLHRLHRMLNAGDVPYEARDGDWRDGRPREGSRPDVLRQDRPRHARARARCPSWRSPARARPAMPTPPNSTAAWAAASRGSATGPPAPSGSSPTRSAPPSASRPPNWTTPRRSIG